MARGAKKKVASLTTGAFSHSEGSSAVACAAPLEIDHTPLASAVFASLDEAKAENIVGIDLGGKTQIADAMIIASGRSSVHVGAIADRVIKACKAVTGAAPRVEGMAQCDWVLIDAGDLIVHVFRPEARVFYNLEKMWGGDRPRELRLA